VLAWAFSVNQDTTLPQSPFGSVMPATAQQDPNTVSTSQPVAITAAALITGAGRFSSWLQLSGDGTVHGATLTVPAGGSSVAVAFYSIPVPDPCQAIRDQLEYLSPEDFDTLTGYERAAAYFRGQLKECEQKYGELP